MSEPVFIQVLSAIPVLKYFADFYHQVIPEADIHTGTWPLMSSPDIPVAIVLVYLFIVIFFGPCCMRYIKVPEVNKVLVIYNSFVLTLNLWLGISLTWHISRAGYQLGCQKVGRFGVHENAISSLLWIFHCSKIIELIDTLFLVLKKKGKQLTFLHLYHHSTIVCATWIGVKFVPGGSSAVIAMVNSWIHVFMYFYYEMMVLRVKTFRNYKKFVTILQIVQFLATIVHCNTALRKDCGYPRWILTWLLLYMISFLVLFLHFYVQTYWKPKNDENSSVPKTMKELEENGKNELWEKSQIQNFGFSDDEDHDQEVVGGGIIDGDRDVELANGEELPQSTTFSTTTKNEEMSDSNGDFDIVQWENLEESDIGISSDESIDSEKDVLMDDDKDGGDEDGNFTSNHFTSSTVQSS